jgi:hypothetical protein
MGTIAMRAKEGGIAMNEQIELRELWIRLLGTPPSDAQFFVWVKWHTLPVVHRAILKTAGKDLSLGKTMSRDHKIRFASKVMISATERNLINAENQKRLSAEMETKKEA